MSASSSTTYYNLPQFASSDIPTWDDINTAFSTIDTALHDIATSASAGITQAQAQTLINTALVGAVFHNATSGTGVTSAQYSKLYIKTSSNREVEGEIEDAE